MGNSFRYKTLCNSGSSLSFYFDSCAFENVEQKVCSEAICHFKELGNDGRRPGRGRKRTVNAARNRKAIEKRVQKIPKVSMGQFAPDMGISDSH
ncbi:hypothetical protein TNCV_3468161 [Trichonephila clavipes]|nr:hypothetical protein TNCV_3468161 [Trichonephila clavipes]